MNRNEREREKKGANYNLIFEPKQQRLMHTCVLWTLVGHPVCAWVCVCQCDAVHSAVQAAWEMCRVDRNTGMWVCVCVCVQQDAATSFRLVLYLWRWVSLNAAACFFSSDLSSERQEPLHLVFDLGAKWKPPGCTNTITSRPWCSDRKILC